MPSGKHFYSVGLGMKLASFVSAPAVHDVTTMDKLTDSELARLILEENHLDYKDELGHLLTFIFRSYTNHIPKAEELTIPLKKIPSDFRTDALLDIEDEETRVSLYDGQNRRWNWALPTSYKPASHTGSGVGRRKDGRGDSVLVADDSRTEADPVSEPESTADEADSDSVLRDDPMLTVTGSGDSGDQGTSSDSDAHKDSEASELETGEIGPLTTEVNFGSFFNTISSALLLKEPSLAQKHNLSRKWSAANSSRPVRGEEIARKPDLTLLDDLEARWDTIKAVCELTASPYQPSQTIVKTLDSKAYLLLKHQPWRRFALFISLCNGYRDLRVHLYDHSGGVVSPCTNIDKEPDKYLHIFSCIVFGNLECIGFDSTISMLKHTLHRTLELSGSRPTKNLPSKKQDLIKSAPMEVVESSQLEEIELPPPTPSQRTPQLVTL
jgi:hypothetical protein